MYNLKKIKYFISRHTPFIMLAFGYLSRFPLGRSATSTEMGKALSWLPFVGLSLGFVALFPFAFFNIFMKFPLLQAWGYTLLLLWLTRAMHLDGFADVLDALGSGKTGEEFLTVMKDSRIGVFGTAGVTLSIVGMIVISYTLFTMGNTTPFVIAPMLARITPYVLSMSSPAHPRASLGKLMELVPQTSAKIIIAIALFLSIVVLPLKAFFLSMISLSLLIVYTHRIAEREGGYSGDYLGFIITAGELCVLFSCLISS